MSSVNISITEAVRYVARAIKADLILQATAGRGELTVGPYREATDSNLFAAFLYRGRGVEERLVSRHAESAAQFFVDHVGRGGARVAAVRAYEQANMRVPAVELDKKRNRR